MMTTVTFDELNALRVYNFTEQELETMREESRAQYTRRYNRSEVSRVIMPVGCHVELLAVHFNAYASEGYKAGRAGTATVINHFLDGTIKVRFEEGHTRRYFVNAIAAGDLITMTEHGKKYRYSRREMYVTAIHHLEQAATAPVVQKTTQLELF